MDPPEDEPRSKYAAPIVSIFALVIYLVAIGVAYLQGTRTNDFTLLVALCGMAATNAQTAINYWVGSSASSQRKDAVIANVVNQHGLLQRQLMLRLPAPNEKTVPPSGNNPS